jgi:iron complex outermembrane receptor protein
MKGESYGVEIWGSQQVNDWWRLSAGFNTLHKNLRFKNGSSGSLGLPVPGAEQAGNDPPRQASVRSTMSVGANFTFDADLRYIGTRPNPETPSYYELNARVGWKPTKPLEISLSGFNLLHAHHIEYAADPASVEVPRSVFVQAYWRY